MRCGDHEEYYDSNNIILNLNEIYTKSMIVSVFIWAFMILACIYCCARGYCCCSRRRDIPMLQHHPNPYGQFPAYHNYNAMPVNYNMPQSGAKYTTIIY